MRTASLLVMIVLVLGTCAPAVADIYVWRDADGVRHYTNDLANVPSPFRGTSRIFVKDWVRAAPPPPASAPPVPAAPAAPASAGDPTPDPPARGLRGAPDPTSERVPGEAGIAAFPASANAPTIVVWNSVVQNVEVAGAGWNGLIGGPVAVPWLVDRRFVPRRTREHRGGERAFHHRRDIRSRFPPASRAPFLQLPAGPPPISIR